MALPWPNGGALGYYASNPGSITAWVICRSLLVSISPQFFLSFPIINEEQKPKKYVFLKRCVAKQHKMGLYCKTQPSQLRAHYPWLVVSEVQPFNSELRSVVYVECRLYLMCKVMGNITSCRVAIQVSVHCNCLPHTVVVVVVCYVYTVYCGLRCVVMCNVVYGMTSCETALFSKYFWGFTSLYCFISDRIVK